MNREGTGFVTIGRRIGQSIQIGENIEITITSKKGGIVRLGVRAPKELNIERTNCERALKKKEENYNV